MKKAQVLIDKLLEVDPDDIDPRAIVKKLISHYWIVSWDEARDAAGKTVFPALDYPVQAIAKKDAIEMATTALVKAGYDLDSAYLIDAYIVQKSLWNELKQVWGDITQQDVERGKFGAMWSHRCVHCNRRIKQEQGVWVDDTGGDVCGHAGGNEPHDPK